MHRPDTPGLSSLCAPHAVEVLSAKPFDWGGYTVEVKVVAGEHPDSGAYTAIVNAVKRPLRRLLWYASVVWLRGPQWAGPSRVEAERAAIEAAKADPAVQEALRRMKSGR